MQKPSSIYQNSYPTSSKIKKIKSNHILYDSFGYTKPPSKHAFNRLFKVVGEWSDDILNKAAFFSDTLTLKDEKVLLGTFRVMFNRIKRKEKFADKFSQYEISLSSRKGISAVNRTLSKLMTNSPDFVGYNDESHPIKRANCSEKYKRGNTGLIRKINKSAYLLVCSFQGFSVNGSNPGGNDKVSSFEANEIRQRKLRYSFGKDFLINLPYLSKLSPFFYKVFEEFKRSSLITTLKKKVIEELGIKQVESFSRFSVAALLWAGSELKKATLKSKRIRNAYGFLWYRCFKYHKDYCVLFE